VTAVQDVPTAGPLYGERAGLFVLDDYLRQFNPRMFAVAECRRLLTRLDPLLFALVYLPHHLRGAETGEKVTFSEFHLDVYEEALKWSVPGALPAQDRDCYVAPRNAGKSTLFFLILPIWAAAHGHRKFIAAFADSGNQAEQHLATFKMEMEQNDLLREDFPELCTPMRTRSGGAVANRQSMYMAESGFVFGAKGIDSSSLGMKVGRRRPDLILCDDVEPDESNYSPYQKEKRLSTLTDAVLPLSVFARVVLVGTVTMPGSIVHDLVKTITKPGEEAPDWIADENWRVHYYPAILTDDDTGQQRSLWPAKWSLAWLLSIAHTRSYKKNYANDPMARDGVYWNEEDIVHHELPALTHQIITVDPAVTSKGTSDYTAIAVIGYSAHHQRVVVRAAWAIRIQPGEPLRKRMLGILDLYPETRGIVVEANQGGDTWKASVLTGMPVPVRTVHQSEPKEVRAARLLNWYQTKPRIARAPGAPTTPAVAASSAGPASPYADLPYVVHEQAIPQLEEQLVGFPNAAHDDLVDTVGTGADIFLGRKKKSGVRFSLPGADLDED
jgi:hypothetical protein